MSIASLTLPFSQESSAGGFTIWKSFMIPQQCSCCSSLSYQHIGTTNNIWISQLAKKTCHILSFPCIFTCYLWGWTLQALIFRPLTLYNARVLCTIKKRWSAYELLKLASVSVWHLHVSLRLILIQQVSVSVAAVDYCNWLLDIIISFYKAEQYLLFFDMKNLCKPR